MSNTWFIIGVLVLVLEIAWPSENASVTANTFLLCAVLSKLYNKRNDVTKGE